MANRFYEAGETQGYDFAFDAVRNWIDIEPLVEAAEDGAQTVYLGAAMLFPSGLEEQEPEDREPTTAYPARVTVEIPEGSSPLDIRRLLYSAIRDYIRAVGNALGLAADETPAGAVALLSYAEIA